MTVDDLLLRVVKIIPIMGLVGLLVQASSFFVSQRHLPETGEKDTSKTMEVEHVR